MKQLLSILFVLVILQACKQEIQYEMPLPTDGTTHVKEDMENPEKSNAKKEWLKKIFRTPDGITAEEIETQNAYRRFLKRNNNITTRTPIEEIADGLIQGEWLEKGSRNQSGSVFKTAYDQITKEVFLVSAGSQIWKGGLEGFSWEIVNQKARFHNNFIDVVYTDEGKQRILGAIANKPHYSDDGGENWIVADGYETKSFQQMKDVYTNDDDLGYTYLLGLDNTSTKVGLYISKDKGVSYQRIHQFYASNMNDISLSIAKKSKEIFIVEEVSNSNSRAYKMDADQENVVLLEAFSPFTYGGKNAKLVASVKDTTTYLYGLSDKDGISTYLSKDLGKTWEQRGVLPTNPWGVGIFVSSENPDFLMYGDIECYRSFDGGESWEMINGWGEYYGDVFNKLHADMMWFSDYIDQETNEYFMLISNHGGISKMYEYDQEPENFALIGLNVSQYYSVRTSPIDEEWIYAGAQDQGFQRAKEKEGELLDFTQPISGDYGHIVFTKDEHLWTVYPGGWVSYWPNPEEQGIAMSYTIDSDDESVWIPPLVTIPNGIVDQIYMAGGNANGGSGSHIIKLTAANQIEADQNPFDFKAASGGVVSAISIVDEYEEKIYVATDNGRFFYSTDYGGSFEQSDFVNGGHYLYGQVIIPSKLSPNVIYTGGTGYNGVPVMRSIDGGQNFDTFGEGLPNTTVLGMVMNEEESLLFAATTSGPYVCIISQGKWYDMTGEAAPDVTYWSVELVKDDNTVRFGTYGRGIWDFNISTFVGNEETELATIETKAKIYPNPVIDYTNVEWPEGEIKDAAIFDIQGRFIMNIDVYNSKSTFSLGDLNAGQYILRYNHNDSIKSQNISKI